MANNNDFKNAIFNRDVYIRTVINPETTADIITGLTKLEQTTKFDENVNLSNKIYKPTDSITTPVVNVYISSNGGEDSSMFAILHLFDMLKSKGTIIRTYNLSVAASCAGIIAIYGTPGYRYMASHSYNLIHFGRYNETMNRQPEIEISHKDIKACNEEFKNLYLATTNLTPKEINRYFEKEGSGKLGAKDCLAKGLCDWVITPRGWTNNVQDLIDQKIR